VASLYIDIAAASMSSALCTCRHVPTDMARVMELGEVAAEVGFDVTALGELSKPGLVLVQRPRGNGEAVRRTRAMTEVTRSRL
jgi:hypothetical protein